MGDLNFELNRLAGTTGLDAAGAANAYAGTVGKELVGALNSKAGTSGLELVGVANKLAGTTGLDLLKALQAIASFTPTQVTGLLAWYDASVASSITSVATAVSQWNDLSGSGNHLTQGTAGKKPKTGTRTINSLNVIDFDGTDDEITNTTTFTFTGTTMSAYVVFKLDGDGGRLASFAKAGSIDYDNPQSAALVLTQGAGNTGTYYNNAQIIDKGSSFGTSATQFSAFRNGTAWTGRVNQAAITGGTSVVTAFNAIQLWLGNSPDEAAPLDGVIAEFLLYNTFNSTTNRDLIEAYLKAKWGTP